MKSMAENKLKYLIEDVLKFNKIEFIVIGILILFLIASNWINPFEQYDLKGFFSTDRISTIINFSSISIGIYITIISILATTITSISVKYVEKKLDQKIISFVVVGLFTNIILVIYLILIPEFWNYYVVLFVLTLISIESFIKFIVWVILTFKYNMKSIAKDIDSNESFKREILYLLDKISTK